MTIGQSMLPEFDQEMSVTRRVLERVPSDRPDWKPHPKSFSMAHLAQLVSWMPGWIGQTLTQDSLDLGKAAGYSNELTETLLKGFDAAVKSSREALNTVPDAAWSRKWHLKRGDMVLWTGVRDQVVRTHISHLVHHRAQLTVYLRQNDIPVPAVYGPSADDRTF